MSDKRGEGDKDVAESDLVGPPELFGDPYRENLKTAVEFEKEFEGISTREIFGKLSPFFSLSTIGRIRNYALGKAKKFPENSLSLAKLVMDPFDFPITYKLISTLVHQSQADFETLRENCAGDYFFYRFFPTDNDPQKYDYVRGRISIKVEKHRATVRHWTHKTENKDGAAAENTGYAFYVSNRLVLPMFRPKVLRLATAHVPDNEEHEPFSGIVHSVIKNDPHSTFSSRFIMVKCNSELVKKFDPEYDNSGSKFKVIIENQVSAEYGFMYGRLNGI